MNESNRINQTNDDEIESNDVQELRKKVTRQVETYLYKCRPNAPDKARVSRFARTLEQELYRSAKNGDSLNIQEYANERTLPKRMYQISMNRKKSKKKTSNANHDSKKRKRSLECLPCISPTLPLYPSNPSSPSINPQRLRHSNPMTLRKKRSKIDCHCASIVGVSGNEHSCLFSDTDQTDTDTETDTESVFSSHGCSPRESFYCVTPTHQLASSFESVRVSSPGVSPTLRPAKSSFQFGEKYIQSPSPLSLSSSPVNYDFGFSTNTQSSVKLFPTDENHMFSDSIPSAPYNMNRCSANGSFTSEAPMDMDITLPVMSSTLSPSPGPIALNSPDFQNFVKNFQLQKQLQYHEDIKNNSNKGHVVEEVNPQSMNTNDLNSKSEPTLSYEHPQSFMEDPNVTNVTQGNSFSMNSSAQSQPQSYQQYNYNKLCNKSHNQLLQQTQIPAFSSTLNMLQHPNFQLHQATATAPTLTQEYIYPSTTNDNDTSVCEEKGNQHSHSPVSINNCDCVLDLSYESENECSLRSDSPNDEPLKEDSTSYRFVNRSKPHMTRESLPRLPPSSKYTEYLKNWKCQHRLVSRVDLHQEVQYETPSGIVIPGRQLCDTLFTLHREPPEKADELFNELIEAYGKQPMIRTHVHHCLAQYLAGMREFRRRVHPENPDFLAELVVEEEFGQDTKIKSDNLDMNVQEKAVVGSGRAGVDDLNLPHSTTLLQVLRFCQPVNARVAMCGDRELISSLVRMYRCFLNKKEHLQLSRTLDMYMLMDQNLAPWIVQCMLRHWPSCESQRCVVYLDKLASILRVCSASLTNSSFKHILTPLIWKLICCIRSNLVSLALQALRLLRTFGSLLLSAQSGTLDVYGRLQKALTVNQHHWNSIIQSHSAEISLKLSHHMDAITGQEECQDETLADFID